MQIQSHPVQSTYFFSSLVPFDRLCASCTRAKLTQNFPRFFCGKRSNKPEKRLIKKG